MSRNLRARIVRIENSLSRKKVAEGDNSCAKLSAVDDALALLADAQRRINTAQEQIDKARKILKAS